MKTNVDLTENGDFSSKGTIVSLSQLFSRGIFKIYPWDLNDSIVTKLNLKEQLIFTGNKKNRQEKKERVDYYNQLNCECCGKEISGWRNYYGLCKECCDKLEMEVYNYKNKRKPWNLY